jgi:hypothetical protein
MQKSLTIVNEFYYLINKGLLKNNCEKYKIVARK